MTGPRKVLVSDVERGRAGQDSFLGSSCSGFHLTGDLNARCRGCFGMLVAYYTYEDKGRGWDEG